MTETKNLCAKCDYRSPSIEVVTVEVEGGYMLSNDQEPSPWEEM